MDSDLIAKQKGTFVERPKKPKRPVGEDVQLSRKERKRLQQRKVEEQQQQVAQQQRVQQPNVAGVQPSVQPGFTPQPPMPGMSTLHVTVQ